MAGTPNAARVYDYWVGGKDSRLPDREIAREVLRHRPQVMVTVQANRAFGQRVTTYAAHGCGIRQFLDIGTGLPAQRATHQTAQQISRDCRVVYADHDPLVLAHARALLKPGPGGVCDYIEADVCDPAALLASSAAALDFAEPVAVLLLAVLHFVPDEEDPAGIVEELAAGLAPGSLIAVSHLTADFAPGAVAAAVAAYNDRMPVPVRARDRDQVTALLGQLPVAWPGVVPVSRWRPPLREVPGRPVDMYGGVALLPAPGSSLAGTLAAGLAPPPPIRGDEPPADLAARAAGFPGHRISTETVRDRTRYVAHGTSLASRPYAVITSDPDELLAELTAAQDSQPAPVMADGQAGPPGPGVAVPGQSGGER